MAARPQGSRLQAKERSMQQASPGVPCGTATGVVPFRAFVLVGGQGTRLRAVVADRPKPLALVDGEPFVARLLDQLAAAGCREAILCTGHLADAVARELGQEHGGMPLRYSRESEPLGTGGAVRAAWAGIDDAAALVCNGDSFLDFDLATFVRTMSARAESGLVGAAVADAGRYGGLTLGAMQADGCALVHAFREKGGSGPATVSAGICWLARHDVLALPAGPSSLERDLLPRLALEGRLVALPVAAPFLDIGMPADYARAAGFFAGCAARRVLPRQGLLVVDRDGTLIAEKHYLADPAGVELLPGVVDGLRAFAKHGYEVAVVTNQSGVGRGYFDETKLAAVHAELCRQLARHGIELRGILHCPHTPADACACRKPEPGLLQAALREFGYRPEQCLVVGDKDCDIELGARLGVRTALVRTGYGLGTERDGRCVPDRIVDDLRQLAREEIGA
ncbi:MAG: HAD-IIIA family hydrolase [Planctomycetes bacterium]|nr:HAD-IIIA family hydrolase [Planctomycetota bacterium]